MPYVESHEKVRRTLLEAIEAIGMERFLAEAGASREDVEGWLRGEGWVPLRVLLVACSLRGGRSGALERLNEVMEGLEVVAEPIGESPLRRPKPSIEASSEALGKAGGKGEGDTGAEALRRRSEMSRTFSRLLFRSTVLVLSMFLASLAGYILGSPLGTLYAGLGLLIPILAGIFICLLWSLRAKPSSA